MKLSEKMSVAALGSVLIKFVLAGLTVKYGENSMTVGGIDGITIGAILTPVLGAHHLGSWIETKGKKDDDKS